MRILIRVGICLLLLSYMSVCVCSSLKEVKVVLCVDVLMRVGKGRKEEHLNKLELLL